MTFQSYNEADHAITRFIERREGEFDQLAFALHQLQAKHVPAIAALCQNRGIDSASLDQIDQIPAIPTTAFRDMAITSIPENNRTSYFESSGTTATQPSVHWHHEVSMSLYETSLIRPFQHHVLNNHLWSGQTLALTPPPAEAPHSSLAHMAGQVLGDGTIYGGQCQKDGWSIDSEICESACAKAIHDNTPLLLFGPAFSFLHWLDSRESFYKLPNESRIMETGGYKGRSRELPKNEFHGLLSERLGVPESHIVCEYGMCELSSQAYDRKAGTNKERTFHFPAWARPIIINTETGAPCEAAETGLLRIIDLANVYSSIAIQTQDLARSIEDGFELLGRAQTAELRGCSLNLLQ